MRLISRIKALLGSGAAELKSDQLTERELIRLKGFQPVARISDDDLVFLIQREFPNDVNVVRDKLNGIDDFFEEKNRISAAVLKLADGDITRLDEFVQRANSDFRDVLAPAEYPRQFRYGFGNRTEEESKEDSLQDWGEYCAWKERSRADG